MRPGNGLGISRGFVLIEHIEIPAPFTVGIFHPVIHIPKGFTEQLSVPELKSLAIHELAHVKRYDAPVLSFVTLVRALFFFNPFVWYAASQVATLAEHACDDAVLETVDDPVVYAEMLARIAVKLPKRIVYTAMNPGFIFSKHAFLRRVEVILSGRRDKIRNLSRLALTGTMAVIGLSLAVALAVPIGVTEKPEAKSITT